MKHIMFDLETLGTEPDAAVIQVGAVGFDPFLVVEGSGKQGAIHYPEHSFRMQVHLNDPSIGHIDGPTVGWWMGQPERTRQKVFLDNQQSLTTVLTAFTAWVEAQGEVDHVWCKGAAFDFPILKEGYLRTGVRYPFNFRKERCFRTLTKLVPNAKALEPLRVGTHHDALDDAYHQAGWAIVLLQTLPK